MKVTNMTSSRGNKVPNQFIITGEHNGQKGEFFQSYRTTIAFMPMSGASVVLDKEWNYSRTTQKYLNQFLNSNKKEIEQRIDSGAYIVTELNN